MRTSEQLCSTIEKINPGMGRCGVNFAVAYDDDAGAWAIDFHDRKHHLKTFVESADVDSCLDRDMCLPLALEIGQLRTNFDKYIHEHELESERS